MIAHYCFASPDILMDLVFEHQWQLISQKKNERNKMESVDDEKMRGSIGYHHWQRLETQVLEWALRQRIMQNYNI